MRIVITGASSGIGAALLRTLIADKHEVIGCARRGGVDIVPCDVRSPVQVQLFRDRVLAKWDSLDALITCAGVFGAIGRCGESDPEDWWDALETNLRGTYLAIHEFVPLLRNASSPRIITFAGGGAFGSFPRYSAYAASKAAVVRLTQCAADEWAGNIAVNAIAPGFLMTGIHMKTLDVGPAVAGAQYGDTLNVLQGRGTARMENVLALVATLLTTPLTVTGQVFCAQADGDLFAKGMAA